MPDQWTLRRAMDWVFSKCVEQHKTSPLGPGLDIWFPQQLPPDVPPSTLVVRAFHTLEEDGCVTGHVILSDNAGAIAIRGLKLSDRAVLKLETSPDPAADEGHAHIGFSNE